MTGVNYREDSLVVQEQRRLAAKLRGERAETAKVPCPFVYAKGRRCTGHIVRVEAFKADLEWTFKDDGTWTFGHGEPRSHYHLFCSEKGNHTGYGREDSQQMKRHLRDLPKALLDAIELR